jgi:hypothetical protein
MELMKKLPAGVVIPIARYAFLFKKKGRGWHKDQAIRMMAAKGLTAEECVQLFYCLTDKPQEVEIYLAGKSPSAAARWAVGRKERLCKEAEDIVIKKSKEVGLILYCSEFGIVLGDLTKVTMKAAFDDKAWREKRYIKKIEDARRNLKHFLIQLMNVGELKADQTVAEVLQTLE